MAEPRMSAHFEARTPSGLRIAGMKFAARTDGVEAVNVAIGNVTLPMHPAMTDRMKNLGAADSPFVDGVVRYTGTVGRKETNEAFLNIIAASGYDTTGLHCQVTDGGSLAMELCIVGCCGPAGSSERPLLLIDAAYSNYKAFAERVGRSTVSITRTLGDDGRFSLPSLDEIRRVIQEHKPGAMVVIPYDNPTGQLYDKKSLVALAELCVENGMWMISDEAYRELYYTGDGPTSVWMLTEEDVPGISGHRISIETSSKVWNACGLRIGGLVTDSADFHDRAVAENTAGLCSNNIGQYIFASLAEQSHAQLQNWFSKQREYYREMLVDFTTKTRQLLPEAVVSSPDASIYSVIELKNIVKPGFNALDFVLYCATDGVVEHDGRRMTLLTAPMSGFYNVAEGQPNPGATQLRVAYVETPDKMKHVPYLLAELLRQYEANR